MPHSTAKTRYPLELSVWLSPAFPVGSFAYSHGLEWAVGTHRIHDRASATAWLADLLDHGGARNDAILLAEAWRATCRGDWAAITEINELALALVNSRERRLETVTQGNAFLTTILAAWSNDNIVRMRAAVVGDLAYPVAVGIASAAHELPLGPTLQAFLAGFVANMTSALVRMSVIGQTDAQRVIAVLTRAITRLAISAENSTLDDLGTAAVLSEIAAMAHETQETRMFRT